MSYVKDFFDLKVSFRSSLLSLIIQAPFFYVSIYFIAPDFVTKTFFPIPILFSICTTFLIILSWNVSMLFGQSGDFTKIDPDKLENRAIVGAVLGVLAICAYGLYGYCHNWDLMSYTVSVVVCLASSFILFGLFLMFTLKN